MDEPKNKQIEEVGHGSIKTYLLVFVGLAVLTALEVWVSTLPIARIPILVFLAVVKAAMVALFYMHLKFDRPIFRALFILGVFAGVGLIISFVILFAPPLMDVMKAG